MERLLRPERLDADPSSSSAGKDWLHWIRTFENFLTVLPRDELNKLQVLTNYISPPIFEYIEHCRTYDEAIGILKALYVKPTNEVFARHQLATRRQQSGETIDEFLQALKVLTKDCNFKSVTAAVYKDEAVRDSFITGLQSNTIRQRLLENNTLDLDTMFTQARTLDTAQKSSESYSSSSLPLPVTAATLGQTPPLDGTIDSTLAAATGAKCFFCGYTKHPRQKCPARDATCSKCQKKGHFAKVCRSSPTSGQPGPGGTVTVMCQTLAAISSSITPSLIKSSSEVTINGASVRALIDSGSTDSFIHPTLVDNLGLQKYPDPKDISMAQSSLSAKTLGHCVTDLQLGGKTYSNLSLSILPGLCSELILGLDFQKQHQSVSFQHGGPEPPLVVGGLSTLKVEPPDLFTNLTADHHPIATKSRRYSYDDRKFIDTEVQRLLKEGVIEPSNSPWRAQVVVTRNENHKKRMVIDYSQTINRFTLLDAYPLPRIDDTVNAIAQYRVFSTIDLRSAYHQVRIKEADKPYTAFQAGNALYQFTRIPFGVTNGVACFQRIISNIVAEEKLQGTFPYLDNVTICGRDQEEHDRRLKCFQDVASRRQITYNNDKCTFSTRKLAILGSIIEEGEIRPDPERLRPLQELPAPKDAKSLRRILGLFSYYSQWIQCYSEKIRPLARVSSFPISEEAKVAFETLKRDIEQSVVCAIDEQTPFEVETDASDFAIAATLNQNGRPVAFFSRTLQGPEVRHASVEKEAQAIIEAIRHWRHYLTGRHFSIKTDQRSVVYMFDNKQKGKIKNEKIMRWRIELSCYSFDIIYRPGPENVPPDALSRAFCAAVPSTGDLAEVHNSLCHPGVTRMFHFVKTRNLPYSMDDVRQMTKACRVCAEYKPQFHKPVQAHLIKATQPFERLNIDFKGPLKSNNQNIFFLNIIDEYSRFPFVYPCKDVSTRSVIQCLCQLFSIFGMPAYIHSDRGASFMSEELRQFLLDRGIATSRTTAYNPACNGQVEKYNGTVWKAICMALKTRGLPKSHWQDVLPDALHSQRSLLCTATNCSPHERFFKFERRSSTGGSVPTWLMTARSVLLKRHMRTKSDPLVEEVQLLQANPQYAHVRYADGRETTVSIRHLAPTGDTSQYEDILPGSDTTQMDSTSLPLEETTSSGSVNSGTDDHGDETTDDHPGGASEETTSPVTEALPLRRSQRQRNPPDRFDRHCYSCCHCSAILTSKLCV